jgi:hypothetical protein
MTRLHRTARVLYWLVPIAFCIALYWRGMRIWFAQDDFAWLGLRIHVTDFRSFLWAMFTPLAQGTIRPFSERGFFMLFSYFFGLRALPFRLFVFLNQFVNIVLLVLVTRKLTKSDLAGLVAPLLWLANAAVVTPMAWTSSYNEIQFTTFLLTSFYLFIRYTETGARKFYWAQWVTFVLGFGALELNVVYPALAAFFAILFARRYLLSTIPMFAVSGVYAVIHRMFSAQEKNFYYDLDFHFRPVISTLAHYWNLLLGFFMYVTLRSRPHWIGHAAAILITVVIIGFAAWQTWRRQFLPLFLVGWFLIMLSPLLPLHNHVTDYYMFTASIGIAMLAAYAISVAWKQGWILAAVATGLAALYLIPSVIVAHVVITNDFDRADRVRAIVQSVAYAKRIHPGKTILLKDIDDDMFWSVIYDSPFRIFGWKDVFVTPDSRPQIHDNPNLGAIDSYFLPEAPMVRALNDGTALVYALEDRQLRNVTPQYTVFLNSEPQPALSPSIDVGAPYFKEQVGEGWYGPEGGFRWSRKHAVVYLLGPTAAGQKLTVHGRAPEQQVKLGPLHFALTIDGRTQPVKSIEKANAEFVFVYDLPADLVRKPKIEVAFTLDRTIRVPTDDRDFGVTFGEFIIR